MAEESGVISDSPPEDVIEEPSSTPEPQEEAQPQQGPASPTPETPQAESPVPFGEHPRWKEVQREREALREQNRVLLETLQRVAPQPQPVRQEDPYAGMDAQTAEFWRQVDKRAEQIADRKAAERLGPVERALQLGQQQLAQVTLANFYKDNPDIPPNSQESNAIAEKVAMGYPLEDAKWIVMGPRYAQQAREGSQRTQAKSQQTAHKRQLPPERGPGIPAVSGVPQPAKSFRETLEEELNAGT